MARKYTKHDEKQDEYDEYCDICLSSFIPKNPHHELIESQTPSNRITSITPSVCHLCITNSPGNTLISQHQDELTDNNNYDSNNSFILIKNRCETRSGQSSPINLSQLFKSTTTKKPEDGNTEKMNNNNLESTTIEPTIITEYYSDDSTTEPNIKRSEMITTRPMYHCDFIKDNERRLKNDLDKNGGYDDEIPSWDKGRAMGGRNEEDYKMCKYPKSVYESTTEELGRKILSGEIKISPARPIRPKSEACKRIPLSNELNEKHSEDCNHEKKKKECPEYVKQEEQKIVRDCPNCKNGKN